MSVLNSTLKDLKGTTTQNTFQNMSKLWFWTFFNMSGGFLLSFAIAPTIPRAFGFRQVPSWPSDPPGRPSPVRPGKFRPENTRKIIASKMFKNKNVKKLYRTICGTSFFCFFFWAICFVVMCFLLFAIVARNSRWSPPHCLESSCFSMF